MQQARSLLLDASGATADLGVLIPIAAALVVRNGFDAATVLVGVGGLYLVAGLYLRVPVPVQPIKAASTIAIASGLAPHHLAAAAILIGGLLVLIGLSHATRWVAAVFARPLVRGVQLGVGLILVDAAFRFAGDHAGLGFLSVAGSIAVVLVISGIKQSRVPMALLIVTAGVAYSYLSGEHVVLGASLWDPDPVIASLSPSVLWGALITLVIPQIPLTLGNAVVAVVDVEHRYFGARASRVTPLAVCMTSGGANIVAGLLNGMPMCHGSGGLTAHYRAGARSLRMNVLIGSALLVLGLFFGPTAFGLLGLIPVAVLAGLLAFTGTMHAILVADLRGYELLIAVVMGLIAVVTTNLAISLAVGATMFWPVRALAPRLLAQRGRA